MEHAEAAPAKGAKYDSESVTNRLRQIEYHDVHVWAKLE